MVYITLGERSLGIIVKEASSWRETKRQHEWCRVRLLIYGLNKECLNIASICLKVGDESISVIQFCTKSKGDLTHLSYIFLKTEPIGTELKMVA